MFGKKLFLQIFLASFTCALAISFKDFIMLIINFEGDVARNKTYLWEPDEEGNVFIQRLILSDRPDKALLLADAEIGIHHENGKGYTAFLLAAERGYVELVDMLASKRVDKEHKNVDGNKAIHLAAAKNQAEMIAKLCSLECRKDDENDDCLTAAQLAAIEGHLETTEALIAANADMWKCSGNRSPLVWTVLKGRMKVADRLLEMDVKDVNAGISPEGMSVLDVAADALNVEFVELLLWKKNKMNVNRNTRMPVLHVLVSGPLQKDYLNEEERENWTRPPNDELCKEDRDKLEQIVNMLLDAKADPGLVEKRKGMTALQYAIGVRDRFLFDVFVGKIKEEIAKGKGGVWTRALKSECRVVPNENGESEDAAVKMTALRLAFRTDDRHAMEALIHVQAADLQMSINDARDTLEKILRCEDIETFLSKAKHGHIRDFGKFLSFALNDFTEFKAFRLTLPSFKEGNVYPFYLAVKGIYPMYKQRYEEFLQASYAHQPRRKDEKSVREEMEQLHENARAEVAAFESNQILNVKNVISNELVKLGLDASDEDSVVLALIQREYRIEWHNAFF